MRDVTFAVEIGDLLKFECDVVLLKYAQGRHGVDKQVADAVQANSMDLVEMEPAPRECVLVETRGAIAARFALFTGVPEIYSLEYRDIRALGRRSIQYLEARELPRERIATTTHGAGFGLDETESFLALFNGITEGLTGSRAISSISLVEERATRAVRLERALRETAPSLIAGRSIKKQGPSNILRFSLPESWLSGVSRRRSVDADGRAHAFIAMPFREEFDDVFYYGIEPPVRRVGLLCNRVDQLAFTGDVIRQVKRQIDSASVVIADLTGANPNVFLEVGYAWGRKRPTILLVKKGERLLFDVQGQRTLHYGKIKELEGLLQAELAGLKASGVLAEQ